MRKPYPIKLSPHHDERIQIKGDKVELFDCLIDGERARILGNWLLNAADYLEGKESPVVPD